MSVLGRDSEKIGQLLNIVSEDDLCCHDLRRMNRVIDRCINVLLNEVSFSGKLFSDVTPAMIRELDSYLRGALINDSNSLFVTDRDGLYKDIHQNFIKGIYNVEIKKSGDYWQPVITDKNGNIVKRIIIKYAEKNWVVKGDLNTMVILDGLRNIAKLLNCIDPGNQHIVAPKRREDYQDRYFEAVKKIISAQNKSNMDKQLSDIQEAVDELHKGRNALFKDKNVCVKSLWRTWIPLISKKKVDYLFEDMVYLPQYIALTVYLYNMCYSYDQDR